MRLFSNMHYTPNADYSKTLSEAKTESKNFASNLEMKIIQSRKLLESVDNTLQNQRTRLAEISADVSALRERSMSLERATVEVKTVVVSTQSVLQAVGSRLWRLYRL